MPDIEDLQITLPSNPQDRKKITDALREISNALTEIDDKRSYINDVVKMLKDDFEVEPGVARELAKSLNKHDFPEKKAKFEAIEYMYEALIEGKKDE